MKRVIWLVLSVCMALASWGKIRLPSILGDNMVLQRADTVNIWGWATPSQNVTVKPSWDNRIYMTKAENNGKWLLRIQTPEAGGPYQIDISDGELLTLKDILIGEVWICSGQSNMEMPVHGFYGQPVVGSLEEIVEANQYPNELPVTEKAPIKKAESPYGNTKQINEEIIRDTVASGAPINAIMLRYFNPIGAHPTALLGELPNGVPQNMIPYLTQTAMGIREKLSVFGDDYDTPDGSCIRDFINVVDLAKAHVIAIRRILEKGQKEKVEVFNIGTGRGVSVLELINGFEKATGVKLNYQIVGRRAGDIEKVWANPDFANNELGWKAVETLEDTLRSAWNWQLKLRERGIQ